MIVHNDQTCNSCSQMRCYWHASLCIWMCLFTTYKTIFSLFAVMAIRCQRHVMYKVDIIHSLKSWDETTLRCCYDGTQSLRMLVATALRCCYNVSDCFVARNDTEYSYRISLTWKDIPLNSDAEYICKATRMEDYTTGEVANIVEVKRKYSTVDVVVKNVHVCTAL